MGGKGASEVEVIDYFMSLHYVYCAGPVDSINKLVVGDKDVEFSANTNTTVSLSNKGLFGGEKKGGGIRGAVDVFLGGAAQMVTSQLATRVQRTPTTMPGYRGLCSLFFRHETKLDDGFMWGSNNAALPGVEANITRSPVTYATSIPKKIGDDANPAFLIYECMTNTSWGMGKDPAMFDTAFFDKAAQTLLDELMGISIKWVRAQKVGDFIDNILNHIAGVLYFDLRVRKWRLKLIRQDYVLANTRVLNRSRGRILEENNPTWGETLNEIQVTWTNPANEQTETVTVQSDANIAIQAGEVISDSKNYEGFRRAALAIRAAQRELQSNGAPLKRLKVEADGSYWDVVPGEVIRLDFPEMLYPQASIEMLAVRVLKIDLGDQAADRVILDVSEDVFASPYFDILAQNGLWNDPSAEPSVITKAMFTSAPYFHVVTGISQAAADALVYPQTYMSVVVPSTNNDLRQIDFQTLGTDTNGDTNYVDRGSFDPAGSATVAAAIPAAIVSTVQISAAKRPAPLPGQLAVIVMDPAVPALQELCSVYSVVGDLVTLVRGVLDTVAQSWPAGATILFPKTDGEYIDSAPVAIGETAKYKLLPITSLGKLDDSLSPIYSTLVDERFYKPLRPANVKVTGRLALNAVTVSNDIDPINVTWARRNRKTETVVALSWNAADVTPEAGQTTTVRVYNFADVLLASRTLVAGTSTSFTRAELGNPGTGGKLWLEVESTRDGYISYQKTRSLVTFGNPASITVDTGLVTADNGGYTLDIA